MKKRKTGKLKLLPPDASRSIRILVIGIYARESAIARGRCVYMQDRYRSTSGETIRCCD